MSESIWLVCYDLRLIALGRRVPESGTYMEALSLACTDAAFAAELAQVKATVSAGRAEAKFVTEREFYNAHGHELERVQELSRGLEAWLESDAEATELIGGER